jgi:hypothetical protein
MWLIRSNVLNLMGRQYCTMVEQFNFFTQDVRSSVSRATQWSQQTRSVSDSTQSCIARAYKSCCREASCSPSPSMNDTEDTKATLRMTKNMTSRRNPVRLTLSPSIEIKLPTRGCDKSYWTDVRDGLKMIFLLRVYNDCKIVAETKEKIYNTDELHDS